MTAPVDRHPAFPGDAVAAHWSAQRGLPLTPYRSWGVPLVRDGSVLRTAGGSDFPGVFPDPTSPPLDPPVPPRGVAALILHDVTDEGGVPDQAVVLDARARTYLRYECASAEFGTDPEAYWHDTLSTKRRKRLRHDRRKLAEGGEVTVRWVDAADADAMFGRFFAMLCSRARHHGAYDANVLDGAYLRDVWRRFAGRDLLVSALCVGDRPVSFRTGYAVGTRFVGYMPAIDRAFSTASVGDLHMQLLMPELAALGITSYHMGKGSRGNKEVWATGTYTLSTVVVPLAAGLRARGVTAIEDGRQRLRRAITARGWEVPLRRGLHRVHTRPGATYRRVLEGGGAGGADRLEGTGGAAGQP
ncbi:MAG: GNAT family N-acetyltransferase [Egibacteraceae bacterium]